jgi:hypothetical protein
MLKALKIRAIPCTLGGVFAEAGVKRSPLHMDSSGRRGVVRRRFVIWLGCKTTNEYRPRNGMMGSGSGNSTVDPLAAPFNKSKTWGSEVEPKLGVQLLTEKYTLYRGLGSGVVVK